MRWIILAALAFSLVACDDNAMQRAPTGTGTEGRATGPPALSPPARLSEYDPSSALIVKGRDRLRACVQTLDESVTVEQAAEAIEEALLAAAENRRWHPTFGTPAVDVGCPLPPAALEAGWPFEPSICREEVSPNLVYVFVGEASRFTQTFPGTWLATTGGVRKGRQEALSPCGLEVAEAWYLTADELEDGDLLQRYIFGPLGIFPIAEQCC